MDRTEFYISEGWHPLLAELAGVIDDGPMPMNVGSKALKSLESVSVLLAEWHPDERPASKAG